MANSGAVVRPIYQPALRKITAITNAYPAEVTTSFDHNYVTGEVVVIIIPVGFGMQQINGKTGLITVTGDTTFTVTLDTTSLDPFAIPGDAVQNAEVISIGGTSIYTATKNTLPSYNR